LCEAELGRGDADCFSAARDLVSLYLSSNLQSLVSALLCDEERAPRNQEGQLHGARGCWRVDCGFAEVVTVGGNLSAGAACRDRCTGRAQSADALAALNTLAALIALCYPTRSKRPSCLTRLGPAPSRESFQEFCSVDRANAPGSAQQSSVPVRVSF
jgi:hypothetical protein